jgi:hypothetical protein
MSEKSTEQPPVAAEATKGSSSNSIWSDPRAAWNEATAQLPSKASLKESIHSAVNATNSTLSTLEGTYVHHIQEPAEQTWSQVSKASLQITEQLSNVYQKRHLYGPYFIAGSSLTAGAIGALRRGRVRGAVSALAVGGLAYGLVYLRYEDLDWPTSISDRWK